ncbi:MAG: MDR family MFS transporter [Actinomycetota bacterium]|nr:MDR family MFS transporter [Actinomycetota bacterium]
MAHTHEPAAGKKAAVPAPGDEEGGREKPSRKGWVLFSMSLAFTMTMIDATIVTVALPTIQRSLDLTNTERVWIVNAYLLAYTVFVAAAGKFADRIGQRRMFMLGLLTFTGASVVCGLASNSTVLIIARAVEGLGGAMMTPTSQAIVTTAYPIDERGRALGIYAGVSALGVALGPLLGGVLTTFAGWEWIFFVNIPVGVAAFFLTRFANPPQDRAPDSEPVDWLGLAALIIGLSLFTIAIMESGNWGFGSPSFLGSLIGGSLLIAAFVWIELRREYPLLQLRIFKNRDFTADNIVNFFVRFALFGLSVYGPIFVQDVLGFSAFEAGAATLPATIMLFLVAPRGGKAYDRIGARPLLSSGSLIIAVGFLWLAAVLHLQSYPWMIPAYVIAGFGVGFITSPALTDAMNAAPADMRGQAAGVIGTIQQLGGTMGTAVITAVLTPLFVNKLAVSVGETTQAVQAALAQTQGGSIPSSISPQTISAAKEAFASSLAISYVIVIAVMVASFFIGFFLHSRRKPTSPSGPTVIG